MAQRGGNHARWDRDQDVLDRLDEHQRVLRAASSRRAGRETVIARQGITPSTFYEDERRIKILYGRAIGREYAELVAEVDAGYRQVVEDADVLSAHGPELTAAAHQANKLKALDSRVHLHGLAKKESQHEDLGLKLAGIIEKLAEAKSNE